MTEIDYNVWVTQMPQLTFMNSIETIAAGTTKAELNVMLNNIPDNAASEYLFKAVTLLGLTNYTKDGDDRLIANKVPATDAGAKIIQGEFRMIAGLWHQWLVTNKPPVAPAGPTAPGNFTFKIVGGDVHVCDKDGKILQTVKSNAVYGSTEQDYCATNYVSADHQKACNKYLAFIAGVGGPGNRPDLEVANIGLSAKDAGGNNEVTPEAQFAHSYAILRRVGWRAHSNAANNANIVFRFEDFTRTDRRYKNDSGTHDGDAADLLRGMLTGDDAAKNTYLAYDDEAWKAHVAKNGSLNQLGLVVAKAIGFINQNTNFKNATRSPQSFLAPGVPENRTNIDRLGLLVPATPMLYGMYGGYDANSKPMENHVLIGNSASQVGGARALHTDKLRSTLTNLTAMLHSRGKSLASSTEAKFMQKLDQLSAAETEVQTFIEKFQEYNLKNGSQDVASPVVSASEIESFSAASKKLASKTLVIGTGLANIKVKIYDEPTTVVKTSYAMA
jgi:hypothetical protein